LCGVILFIRVILIDEITQNMHITKTLAIVVAAVALGLAGLSATFTVQVAEAGRNLN
jgi:hypothetical protein